MLFSDDDDDDNDDDEDIVTIRTVYIRWINTDWNAERWGWKVKSRSKIVHLHKAAIDNGHEAASRNGDKAIFLLSVS